MENVSSNICGNPLLLDESQSIPLATGMTLVFILAFASNILLISIILKNPKLRTVPNKLVMNLSVCGLFTVIVNGPFVVTTLVKGDWIFSCDLCSFNGFTTTVYGFAAIITLATISISRYQLIRLPNHRKQVWITPDRLPFVILGTWLSSCLLAAPPLFGWSRYEYIPGRAICTLKWSTDGYYTLFILLIGVALPFLVILISYVKIFLTVRTSMRNLKSHRSGQLTTVKSDTIFHEMTTSPAQFTLAQVLPQYSSAEEINEVQPHERRSKWLQKKNKINPNDNSNSDLTSNDMPTGITNDCQGQQERKECTDIESVVKTRINVTDKNRLLLLQLEQSMKPPRNRLKPLKINKPTYPKLEENISLGHRTFQVTGKVKRKNISNQRLLKRAEKLQYGNPLVERTNHGTSNYNEGYVKDILNKQGNVVNNIRGSGMMCAHDNFTITKKPPTGIYAKVRQGEDRSESSQQSSDKSSDTSSNSKPLLSSKKEKSQRRDIWMISRDNMNTILQKPISRKVLPGSFVRSMSYNGLTSSRMKDELKITGMLFVILASFVVCWAPIAIVNIVETIQDTSVSSGMNKFSVFMMFFSSLVNTLTYGLLNRKVRRDLAHLCRLCCACCTGPPMRHGDTDVRAKPVFTI